MKEIWKDRLCAISCGKASQRINNAGKCFLLYHMKELFCVFGLVAQTVESSTGWESRAAEVGGQLSAQPARKRKAMVSH